MEIVKIYNKIDASGTWKVTEFSNGIKSSCLTTPSQAYLDKKAILSSPKTPEQVKLERDEAIDACKTIDELKAFLKE